MLSQSNGTKQTNEAFCCPSLALPPSRGMGLPAHYSSCSWRWEERKWHQLPPSQLSPAQILEIWDTTCSPEGTPSLPDLLTLAPLPGEGRSCKTPTTCQEGKQEGKFWEWLSIAAKGFCFLRVTRSKCIAHQRIRAIFPVVWCCPQTSFLIWCDHV